MKRIIAIAVALSPPVLFPAGSGNGVDPTKPVIIKIGEDMRFSPAKVTIHKGQTVVWQNLSQQIHNVVDIPAQSPKAGVMTLPKGATTFDSGLMKYGQTFVQTFSVTGTYKYACSLHIPNGMLGEITVK